MKRVLAVAVVLLVLGVRSGQACTTPVYRYAMYNWTAEPYRVFYLHRGGPAKEDEAVNKRIAALAEAMPPLVNLVLEPIGLAKRPPQEIPESLRKAWEAQGDKSQPRHVVVSPWGVELFGGRLDSATVDALVDSPARQRIAEMLDRGQVAVLVLLVGSDEADNRRAEKAASELIARAAAGELPTNAELSLGGSEEKQDAKARGLELGLVKLSRSDPAESWLVRLLTSLEPDLNQKPLAQQPMIFAVYGRGRVMPPYVGKGITTENLTELVLFLSGDCSCQVKDSNPGLDLLMRWDWEATAERMAASEDSAERFQPAYAEFAVTMPEPPASEATEPARVEPPSKPEAPVAKEAAATVAVPALTPAPEAGDSSVHRAMWRLGVGFGVVAVVIVLAGFTLVRKRNA